MEVSVESLHRKLYLSQKGACFYCGNPMGPWKDSGVTSTKNGWTRDHFVPQWLLKKKLWNLKYNIVLAHHKCNCTKTGRFPTKEEVLKFTRIYKKVLNF